MGLSAKQLKALKRNPNPRNIRKRNAGGRELSYIEGWYAISEANRIFGFDGWSRETTDARCALARENRGSFLAIYLARVRITVHANGTTIIREGHGTGEGRGGSPGEVHDTALKAAETDATKRALATFGRPFGLELYRGGKAAPAHDTNGSISQTVAPQPSPPIATEDRLGFHPDDTTPIPRPSRYYGRRSYPPLANEIRENRRQTAIPPTAPPLVPDGQRAGSERIDKSALAFPEPKRLRDRTHLKFVATQPCLVCGRQPCDPHHLRFAQPRAIGLKVSDEFTVPLCRGHHRQLHQVGNEIAWWKEHNISPLPLARSLWEQTHPEVVKKNIAESADDAAKR